MALVCKLEAPFLHVADTVPVFRIKIPHTAPAYTDIHLTSSTTGLAFPNHRQVCVALENAVEDATGYGPTVPGTSGDFYAYVGGDGKFVLKSDTMQMIVDWTDAESDGADALRAFLGFTSTTYSAAATITSDVVPPSCFFPTMPLSEEEWGIRLNRTSNFDDAGRVAAILVGRCVGYRCRLRWTNDDHEAWAAFARWMYQGRKVALWPRWDTAASPWTDNYTRRPLPADNGYRLIHLDGGSQRALDAPENVPLVTGHSTMLKGVLHGV